MKREQLNGIKLGFTCDCKGKIFNLNYDLKSHHLFWIIPLGGWEIEDLHVQCIKCGKVWRLEGKMYDDAEKLYWKLKEQEKEA